MNVSQKYLPQFVYGGIDGAITTLAIVAGSIGASLGAGIVLILGFANLFADGFSMGVSNYLASKSKKDLHRKHKDAEQYAMKGGQALKNGIATFASFVIIGFIPLVPFVAALFSSSIEEFNFILSIIFTGFALILVGGIKGKIVEKNKIDSALETLIIGGIAAVLAFSVGFLLKGLVAG